MSVIIPTYNRQASLLRTLESIVEQTYPAVCFEVIVVDDGSTDNTAEVMQIHFPFRCVYVRQQNQGSAAARNCGAQKSNSDILVFIDDDITLGSEYLSALVDVLQDEEQVVAMGVGEPYLTGHDTIFQVRQAAEAARLAAAASTNVEVNFDSCISNNLAVRRRDFLAIGMWQDILGDGPTLWGDVEFGYRAKELGYRFLRVAQARYVHRDHTISDLGVASQRAYHISRSAPYLFARQPGIKAHLRMFHEKEPIVLREDSLGLIGRKLVLRLMWTRPSIVALKAFVWLLERSVTESRLLGLLYRWILSASIYRGYRQGVREIQSSQPY